MNAHKLDHLVYAAPSLESAIKDFADKTGVQPTPGGAHPNWGTRNALVALSPGTYLEIIGPDPEQPGYTGDRPFRINDLDAPALVTWAAKAEPMDEVLANATARGYDPGPARDGSRKKPDGTLLQWSLTTPNFEVGGGIIPFLIDWADSPHPAESAVTGCTLESFELHHPDAEAMQRILHAINVEIEVTAAQQPALHAKLTTPNGRIPLG